MKMKASRLLTISPELTWQALNDPEILKACIPGCERFEADPEQENAYLTTAAVKIGPVSAKFQGHVRLTDIQAPRSYTINFDGQGGVAGHAKGVAKVELHDRPEGVELQYEVEAQVGGKLAQLGQRLVDGTAKSMADQFFKRFEEALMADQAAELVEISETEEVVPTASASSASAKETKGGIPIWFWIIVLAAIIVGVVIAG